MKYKILLVEDNVPIRENTIELLELSDYTVIPACNGVEGLDAALAHLPDLILCDIQMPAMNGYNLLKQVRANEKLNNCRFVFFTASSEKKDVDAAMQMGADDYIIKPFTGGRLLEVLETILPG
jgi:CRP/FNR family transcriptional regulator, cyclic AMP receptor protein